MGCGEEIRGLKAGLVMRVMLVVVGEGVGGWAGVGVCGSWSYHHPGDCGFGDGLARVWCRRNFVKFLYWGWAGESGSSGCCGDNSTERMLRGTGRIERVNIKNRKAIAVFCYQNRIQDHRQQYRRCLWF